MNIKLKNHASEVNSKWSHLNWKGEEIWVVVNTITGFPINGKIRTKTNITDHKNFPL